MALYSLFCFHTSVLVFLLSFECTEVMAVSFHWRPLWVLKRGLRAKKWIKASNDHSKLPLFYTYTFSELLAFRLWGGIRPELCCRRIVSVIGVGRLAFAHKGQSFLYYLSYFSSIYISYSLLFFVTCVCKYLFYSHAMFFVNCGFECPTWLSFRWLLQLHLNDISRPELYLSPDIVAWRLWVSENDG